MTGPGNHSLRLPVLYRWHFITRTVCDIRHNVYSIRRACAYSRQFRFSDTILAQSLEDHVISTYHDT
jgi:hypothetical protein